MLLFSPVLPTLAFVSALWDHRCLLKHFRLPFPQQFSCIVCLGCESFSLENTAIFKINENVARNQALSSFASKVGGLTSECLINHKEDEKRLNVKLHNKYTRITSYLDLWISISPLLYQSPHLSFIWLSISLFIYLPHTYQSVSYLPTFSLSSI